MKETDSTRYFLTLHTGFENIPFSGKNREEKNG